MNRLLTQPVTIRRWVSTPDAYGDTQRTAATSTTVFGYVEQQQRSENDSDQVVTDSTWLLIVDAGTDLVAHDSVIVAGVGFEVIGPPWAVHRPLSPGPHHIEATLRRTTG